LAPARVAALADRALRRPFEDGIAAPNAMEDLDAFVALTRVCRELSSG
jgi:hypothetical protein